VLNESSPGFGRTGPPIAVLALALAVTGLRAETVQRLPWHGQGVWLEGDIHVHRLLDRKKREAILDAAVAADLDFIACTEHTDHVFHREPKKRLEFLRASHPELIVLAGIEWYVPGAGHASVVIAQTRDEWKVLKRFAKRFDRVFGAPQDDRPMGIDEEVDESQITWGELDLAKEALAWLREQDRPNRPRAVVYLNHPSRDSLLSDGQIAELHAAGLAGIEAGPGHQLRDRPGHDDTLDRHEPYVAVVGGGYDQLLARGHNLGLAAGSDYHSPRFEYPPGVFSRTLVYAPERSYDGVIRALAARSTVTVMGGIVRSAWTETSREGLDDPALIGELLEVPRHAAVTYRVRMDIPEWDFEGCPNRIDHVEIISNCLGPPAVVQTFESVGPGLVTLEYELPPAARAASGSCLLRARGRRLVGGEGHGLADADLLFYTGGTRLRFGP
jgi:hypothetical protein